MTDDAISAAGKPERHQPEPSDSDVRYPAQLGDAVLCSKHTYGGARSFRASVV